MTLYCLHLEPHGPHTTPFLADTLMGHLCWAAIRTLGQAGLDELLASACAGQPKLVITDGFPGNLLPMPILPPAPIPEGNAAIQRTHFLQEKERRQAKWVTHEDFRRILQGERITPKALSAADKRQIPETRGVLKNTINRNTGTTLEEGGGLYEFQETFQPLVTVYAQVADGYLDTFKELLAYLTATGYGKRKSIGYGALASPPALEPFLGFDGPVASEANAFVSLSTFVPARDDPTDGYWQILVKYGKLGEEFALSATPFKKPLLMFKAGAVFRLNGAPLRDHYGRIVNDISYLPQDRAKVVQYTMALPVPMKLLVGDGAKR